MLEKEYEFYQKNKEDFCKLYNNKFIVIKNNDVLGAYNSRADALSETIKKHKVGTFLIQEIKDSDEMVIRFHSRVYAK